MSEQNTSNLNSWGNFHNYTKPNYRPCLPLKISCWDKCIPKYQVKNNNNKNVQQEMTWDRKQQSRSVVIVPFTVSGGTLTRRTFLGFRLAKPIYNEAILGDTHLPARPWHSWVIIPWYFRNIATCRSFSAGPSLGTGLQLQPQDLWCQALCCEGQGRWNSCQPHTSRSKKICSQHQETKRSCACWVPCH